MPTFTITIPSTDRSQKLGPSDKSGVAVAYTISNTKKVYVPGKISDQLQRWNAAQLAVARRWH